MHENREPPRARCSNWPVRKGYGERRICTQWRSRTSVYTCEPAEQERETAGGGRGGRPGSRRTSHNLTRDRRRAGKCVPWVERCASKSKGKEAGEVHGTAAPSDRRSAAGELFRIAAEGSTGVDGETWRQYGTGWRIGLPICTAASTWRIPGKALAESLYSEADGRQRPLGIAALRTKLFNRLW